MHRGARQNACPDVTQYSRKAEKEKSAVNQDEGMKLRSLKSDFEGQIDPQNRIEN